LPHKVPESMRPSPAGWGREEMMIELATVVCYSVRCQTSLAAPHASLTAQHARTISCNCMGAVTGLASPALGLGAQTPYRVTHQCPPG
jgi:hypothetical protein